MDHLGKVVIKETIAETQDLADIFLMFGGNKHTLQ